MSVQQSVEIIKTDNTHPARLPPQMTIFRHRPQPPQFMQGHFHLRPTHLARVPTCGRSLRVSPIHHQTKRSGLRGYLPDRRKRLASTSGTTEARRLPASPLLIFPDGQTPRNSREETPRLASLEIITEGEKASSPG